MASVQRSKGLIVAPQRAGNLAEDLQAVRRRTHQSGHGNALALSGHDVQPTDIGGHTQNAVANFGSCDPVEIDQHNGRVFEQRRSVRHGATPLKRAPRGSGYIVAVQLQGFLYGSAHKPERAKQDTFSDSAHRTLPARQRRSGFLRTPAVEDRRTDSNVEMFERKRARGLYSTQRHP